MTDASLVRRPGRNHDTGSPVSGVRSAPPIQPGIRLRWKPLVVTHRLLCRLSTEFCAALRMAYVEPYRVRRPERRHDLPENF